MEEIYTGNAVEFDEPGENRLGIKMTYDFCTQQFDRFV